jgi:hypothetical protein
MVGVLDRPSISQPEPTTQEQRNLIDAPQYRAYRPQGPVQYQPPPALPPKQVCFVAVFSIDLSVKFQCILCNFRCWIVPDAQLALLWLPPHRPLYRPNPPVPQRALVPVSRLVDRVFKQVLTYSFIISQGQKITFCVCRRQCCSGSAPQREWVASTPEMRRIRFV